MRKCDWIGIYRLISGIQGLFVLTCRNIRTRILRRKALCCRDENTRLAAARQLNDETILRQMALMEGETSIRRQAASAVRHPPFLAAIALDTWDIDLGKQVVARIGHDLLLHRVARSARQDAVRLAAAEKLNDHKLMKRIALTTADITLRWEVARALHDPELMTAIALLKPGHEPLDSVRKQAQAALIDYLNGLERENDVARLRSFILIQGYLPFKLLAFLRLPLFAIQESLLNHLACQDYLYIDPGTLLKTLSKIEAAGWSLKESIRSVACVHCKGKGTLALKTVTVLQKLHESDLMECPECSGSGEVYCRRITCARPDHRSIEFRLPYLQTGTW